MPVKQKAIVNVLLDRYGQTYAEEAGIRLADKPAPLYQLLVLVKLLSTRISAEIAVAAAKELFAAGYRTPTAMCEASWQDRVDALGRGHYKRYDESTATRLGDGAELLCQRWGGDLRKLHEEGGDDADQVTALLTEFPGIGPAGASIFLREVQDVWPELAPYLDEKVLDGARAVGLPAKPKAIADLASGTGELVRLAAALVRVSLSEQDAAEVKAAGGGDSQ
jgi:endonuclease III